MPDENDNKTIARSWIEIWQSGDPMTLPLAEDFIHISPLATFRGRKAYLDATIPLAKKNVVDLKILKIVADGEWAVIWYEIVTPEGAKPACDWIRVKGGLIQEIHAFYDASGLLKY